MKIQGKNHNFEFAICTSFQERLIGNMFKKRITNVLCFPKCNSIHTIFLRSPIDVVLLNKEKKVLYVFSNLSPYRILLPKKSVYYVLEFPALENPYKIDDVIEF